jgi:hypothetical protein
MKKPILNLTKKQWQVLLQRTFRRESKLAGKKPGLTPEDRSLVQAVGIEDQVPDPAMMAMHERGGASLTDRRFRELDKGRGIRKQPPLMGELMDTTPPEERTFGRLMKPGGEGMPGLPIDLPHPLAVKAYAGGKGGLTAMSETPPPMDLLTRRRGGRFERRVYKPVKEEGERVKRNVEAVMEDLTPREKAKMKEARTRQATAEKDVDKTKYVKDISEKHLAVKDLQNQAMLMDGMWRFIGMGRSTTGKYWDMLREGARGRRKTESPRDYFIRCGMKWMNEPEKFAKNNKREAKSLETIYKEFMTAMEGVE